MSTSVISKRGKNAKSLANLKSWKPGQSGNPSGKKPDLFTADRLKEIATRLMLLPVSEIKRLITDDTVSMVERMVAQQLLGSGVNPAAFTMIFDRTVGKVKDVAEVHTHDHKDELNEIGADNIVSYLRSKQQSA